MELTRCPYDASPIEAEAHSDGSTRLSCATCGAAWDWYSTRLQRVHEPDREAVRLARIGPAPVIRSAPDPALADAMWRQVKLSSASISDSSDTTPPTA